MKKPIFVVHEHHARTHHFDLRLEHEGVLKSWAVPKGVPTNAGEKRLAIETEDHALEYAGFEGEIPEGHYGAGKVFVFDKGFYEAVDWGKEKIEFVLHGKKLKGAYALIKFKKAGEGGWLLLKARD